MPQPSIFARRRVFRYAKRTFRGNTREDWAARSGQHGDMRRECRNDCGPRSRPMPGSHRQGDFTDHVWLLVAGRLPTDAQRRVLDAALVAIAEHGLVQWWPVADTAAAPESLQGGAAGR